MLKLRHERVLRTTLMSRLGVPLSARSAGFLWEVR